MVLSACQRSLRAFPKFRRAITRVFSLQFQIAHQAGHWEHIFFVCFCVNMINDGHCACYGVRIGVAFLRGRLPLSQNQASLRWVLVNSSEMSGSFLIALIYLSLWSTCRFLIYLNLHRVCKLAAVALELSRRFKPVTRRFSCPKLKPAADTLINCEAVTKTRRRTYRVWL